MVSMASELQHAPLVRRCNADFDPLQRLSERANSHVQPASIPASARPSANIAHYASVERAATMGCSQFWVSNAPLSAKERPLAVSQPVPPPSMSLATTRWVKPHDCTPPYIGVGSGTPMLYQISRMQSTLDRLSGLDDRENVNTSGDDSCEDDIETLHALR